MFLRILSILSFVGAAFSQTVSPTATALVPSITSSPTPTNTISPSETITQTPMFVISAFPTTTASPSFSSTSTPLFMITAWPTTSPINVSPSSSPLYFYTPYPSYDPNNATVIGATTTGTSTATVMGGIAVATSGAGLIGFIINYFRKGGSCSGLAKLAYQNRGKIADNIKKLPLDDLKKHLGDKVDLKKLEEYKKRGEDLYNKLPDSMKDKLKDNMTPDKLIELVENPEKFQQKLKEDITSVAKSELGNLSEHTKGIMDKLPVPDGMKSQIESQVKDLIQKQLKQSTDQKDGVEEVKIEIKEVPLEGNEIQPATLIVKENKN